MFVLENVYIFSKMTSRNWIMCFPCEFYTDGVLWVPVTLALGHRKESSKSAKVEMSWFSLQRKWLQMWQQPAWAARLTIC